MRRNRNISTSHGQISMIDVDGGGPPVLFIHGNSVSKETFEFQLDQFPARRKLALDLPGHGESSDAVIPRRTYSLAGYADCVSEVLSEIGVAEVVVVGWSLGGHIGLELTARFPGLLGLMAVGAPPFEIGPNGTLTGFRPNPKLAISGKRVLSPSDVDEFACLIGDFGSACECPSWVAAVSRADGLAREHMFQSLFEQPPSRQKDLAENCRVPLALVNGSADPFVDINYIAGLGYQNLWSGMTHVLPGYGHAPHVHVPMEFNKMLDRFLADVAPIGPQGT